MLPHRRHCWLWGNTENYPHVETKGASTNAGSPSTLATSHKHTMTMMMMMMQHTESGGGALWGGGCGRSSEGLLWSGSHYWFVTGCSDGNTTWRNVSLVTGDLQLLWWFHNMTNNRHRRVCVCKITPCLRSTEWKNNNQGIISSHRSLNQSIFTLP